MPDIAGLKLIVPTSVAGSGVSVSASGKVTFTAATSVSVNGCFTSSYDNYLIVSRLSASTDLVVQGRLRLSGTDASGSNYTRQFIYADNTSVIGGRNSSVNNPVMAYASSANRNGFHLYVYGPNLAQPTAFRSVIVSGYLGGYIEDDAVTHSLSTAYDGITLYPGAGNISGTLCVYGLAQ